MATSTIHLGTCGRTEEAASSPPTIDVHRLPCKIGGNTKVGSSVDEYFRPGPSSTGEEGVSEVSVRGRMLKGVRQHLPDGYMGYVVQQDGKGLDSDSCTQQWRSVCGPLSQMMWWGHDTVPGKGDQARKCLDWLETAAKVHVPVSMDDVEKEMVRMQQQ